MSRLVRVTSLVLFSMWCSTASANEVRVVEPLPPPPAATPTPETQPTDVAPPVSNEVPPPVPVIQEIPPPPPSYGPPTGVTPAPPVPAPPSSSPPPVQPQPGRHTHDGFFFRGTFGLSTAVAVEENAGEKLRVTGSGPQFTLAVGSALSDMNLALYAEFQFTVVSDPTVQIDEMPAGNVDNVGAGSFGLGATYYFMPINIYLAGTVGSGSANVVLDRDADKPAGQTGTGLSLRGSVGKEWWTSSNWGIGVAAHVLFMSLPDSDHSTLTLLSAGISGTATYN